MSKITHYSIFIVCSTILVAMFFNHMDNQIKARKPIEKIVYTVPPQIDHHPKVYRLDKDTIMLIIDEKQINPQKRK